MLKRKRAPGAGRPPHGDIKKKTTAFTTRITAETRRELAAAAQRHGRSISQEAEKALQAYLKKPDVNTARSRALAFLVGHLAEGIEKGTGKSWLDDKFTARALESAVAALIIYLTPEADGTLAIPADVEQRALKLPDYLAVRYRTPIGFGELHTYHVTRDIEARPRTGVMLNESTLPFSLYFEDYSLDILSSLARDLEIK